MDRRIRDIRKFRVGGEYRLITKDGIFIVTCTRIEQPQIGTYTVFFGYDGTISLNRWTLPAANIEEI